MFKINILINLNNFGMKYVTYVHIFNYIFPLQQVHNKPS